MALSRMIEGKRLHNTRGYCAPIRKTDTSAGDKNAKKTQNISSKIQLQEMQVLAMFRKFMLEKRCVEISKADNTAWYCSRPAFPAARNDVSTFARLSKA